MTKEAALKIAKTAGTALIIGAAALILMPGLLTYVLGLGRILLIVLITLVVATVVGNIIFRFKKAAVQSNKPKIPDAPQSLSSSGQFQGELLDSSVKTKSHSDVSNQD